MSNRNRKSQTNKNNFQDEAMEREFDKGETYGEKKGKPNGRRNGRNSNRRGKETNKDSRPGNGSNNVSWHHPSNISPNTYAVFTHQYDIAQGIEEFPDSFYDKSNNTTIPGIMRMDVIPSLGSNGFLNSALNLAGLELYQTLQAANNRAPQFEYTDLLMYVVATAQLYAEFKWFVRGIGHTRDVSAANRYKPKTLVEAMNLNFEQIKSNKANIITELNIFIDSLNSLYLPKSVDYVERQIWLYDSVYMDANSPRAQLYFLQPTGFWKFVEGSTTNPLTHLEFVDLLGNDLPNGRQALLSYETILSDLWNKYYALANSTDQMNITADMRKAFGDSGTYQVSYLPLDFKFEPVYNETVLSQFENAYIGYPISGSNSLKLNWDWSEYGQSESNPASNMFGACYVNPEVNAGFIQVDLGYIPEGADKLLIKEPSSSAGSDQYAVTGQNAAFMCESILANKVNYVVNFHHDNPTAEDVVEATRLSSTYMMNLEAKSGTDGTYLTSRITGDYATEIIAGAYLYCTQPGSTVDKGVVVYPVSSYYYAPLKEYPAGLATQNFYYNPVAALGKIAAFDWHPQLWYFNAGNGEAPFTYWGGGLSEKNSKWNGPEDNIVVAYHALDYDTYVVVGSANLTNMNRIDLLGQFEPIARKVKGRTER